MFTELAERCLDARLTWQPAEPPRLEFEQAQLHVVDEHGAKPMALETYLDGEAEVDPQGNVTAIWLWRNRAPTPFGSRWQAEGSPWPVPLGHELHRLIAASLRITHARQIADVVRDLQESA